MPLVPLQIPAGVYRNGTEFQASNRWYNANLVRWIEGTLRPVGGWRTRKTVGSTAPRAALAWSDQSGDRWYAAGFHNALKVVSASATLTDITPASLVAGSLSEARNTGYGGNFYGLLGYSPYIYDVNQATLNNVVYPSLDPMIFEVKYPDLDIQGRTVSL